MAADRTHALINSLCGEPDTAAIRAVAVLHAHSAALAWVREATGSYPAPAQATERLREAAENLKALGDDRDPYAVLIQVAGHALAEDRRSNVA